MKSLHDKRRAETARRVMSALALLEKERRRITFSMVAEVAGVSRPTLYNNPALRSAIEKKISRQRDARKRLEGRLRSDSEEIASLKKENAKLRKKIRWQRDVISVINDSGPIDLDCDFKLRL